MFAIEWSFVKVNSTTTANRMDYVQLCFCIRNKLICIQRGCKVYLPESHQLKLRFINSSVMKLYQTTNRSQIQPILILCIRLTK